MNQKKLLSTVLTSITVGSAIVAFGQTPTIVYEQSRIGGGTQANNPDFVFSGFTSTTTSDHSSAPGLVSGYSTSSRIAATGNPGNPGTNVVISPNNGNATNGTLLVGTTYAVAVSFSGSPTAASTDIVVSNSDTGTTGLDTFAGLSTCFQAGNGYNVWIPIGNITIASANPTIKFDYWSGVNGRWNVDSFRFTPVTTPPPAQYWDINGSIGGTGIWDTATTNWNPNANGSGTPQFYSQTDVADFRGTSGTVTITPGGVTTDGGVEFDVNNYIITGGPLTLDATTGPGTNITVLSGDTATLNSVISGSSGLCNAGPGTLKLGAVNTFTGTVTLTAGKLQLATNETFSSLAGFGALALGTNTLTVGGDDTSTTYSGILSDGGSTNQGALVKTGAGTLTLSGANTFAGTTTINEGTINITADNGLGAAPGSLVANQLTFNGNGATLFSSSGGTLTLNSNRGITLHGGSNIVAANISHREITFNDPITGNGSLTILTGFPDFNATNTYAGDLNFVLTNNISARFNTNNSAGLGRIHIIPQTSSGTPCTIRNFAPNGISTTLTNAIQYDESVTNAQNYNIDTAPAGVFTLSGNISGTAAGGVNVNDNANGQGTVVLSGYNSAFSGGFNLQGGTLALGSPTALGTGLFVVSSAGNNSNRLEAAASLTGVNAITNTVYINVASGFIIPGSNPLELSGPIHLGTGTSVGIEVDSSAAAIFSGNIDDEGAGRSLALSTITSGILTLRGSNSYSGGTIINSGTLDGAAAHSIPGDVTVYGGTLQIDVTNAISPNATLNIYNAPGLSLNFTGAQNVAALYVNGAQQPFGTYGVATNNPNGIITGSGLLNVVTPSIEITSESLDTTKTLFTVCWSSVTGIYYDVLTNSTFNSNGSWVSAGSVSASGTTTCFTLPGTIVGQSNVFVLIQQP